MQLPKAFFFFRHSGFSAYPGEVIFLGNSNVRKRKDSGGIMKSRIIEQLRLPCSSFRRTLWQHNNAQLTSSFGRLLGRNFCRSAKPVSFILLVPGKLRVTSGARNGNANNSS